MKLKNKCLCSYHPELFVSKVSSAYRKSIVRKFGLKKIEVLEITIEHAKIARARQ
jgi:hypothetical protein